MVFKLIYICIILLNLIYAGTRIYASSGFVMFMPCNEKRINISNVNCYDVILSSTWNIYLEAGRLYKAHVFSNAVTTSLCFSPRNGLERRLGNNKVELKRFEPAFSRTLICRFLLCSQRTPTLYPKG